MVRRRGRSNRAPTVPLPPLAFVLLILAAASPSVVNGIEHKCSAARIIGTALFVRWEADRAKAPKKLDLVSLAIAAALPALSLARADVDPSSQTNRLDSKGNRLGKVIDYAGSETRFMEMLDGLCSEALPNAVVFDGEGWVALTSDAKRKRANKEHPLRSGAQKQFKTTLGNFCQRTLDEFEDDIMLMLGHDWASKGAKGDAGFVTQFVHHVVPSCVNDEKSEL